MKASKKIVGATAALVAAVALSAGSTFAWFATSGTAKIDGLTVNVKSPTNLYIATGYETEAANITATEVDFVSSTATLSPVTHDAISSGSVSFKYATGYSTDPTTTTSGTADEWQVVGTASASDGLVNEPSQTIANYVAGGQISLVRKAETDSSTTFTLSATVTISGLSEASANYKYLRCAFVDDTQIKESTDYSTISGDSVTSSFTLAEGVSDNAVKNYIFLIWFEGSDSDCYSDNAVVSDNISVSIEFNTANTPST